MKRLSIIICTLVALPVLATGQEVVRWMPYLSQSASYFTSDHITAYGIGGGAGVQLTLSNHAFVRTDLNIYWGNGNTLSNRLALGVQKSGRWNPAIMLSGSLLWGQRTELLNEKGVRPDWPGYSIGLRIAPLRFSGASGTVSAIEIGYGFGPDGGMHLETALLTVGLKM